MMAVTKEPLPEAVLPDIGLNVSQSTDGVAMVQSSVVPLLPTLRTWKVLVVAVSPKSKDSSLNCRIAVPVPLAEAVKVMACEEPAPVTVTDVDTMPAIWLRSMVAITCVLVPPAVLPEVGLSVNQLTLILEHTQLSEVVAGPVFWT